MEMKWSSLHLGLFVFIAFWSRLQNWHYSFLNNEMSGWVL